MQIRGDRDARRRRRMQKTGTNGERYLASDAFERGEGVRVRGDRAAQRRRRTKATRLEDMNTNKERALEISQMTADKAKECEQ